MQTLLHLPSFKFCHCFAQSWNVPQAAVQPNEASQKNVLSVCVFSSESMGINLFSIHLFCLIYSRASVVSLKCLFAF